MPGRGGSPCVVDNGHRPGMDALAIGDDEIVDYYFLLIPWLWCGFQTIRQGIHSSYLCERELERIVAAFG